MDCIQDANHLVCYVEPLCASLHTANCQRYSLDELAQLLQLAVVYAAQPSPPQYVTQGPRDPSF